MHCTDPDLPHPVQVSLSPSTSPPTPLPCVVLVPIPSPPVPHAYMHTAQPRNITHCFIGSMCTRCVPRSAAQPLRPPRSRSGIWSCPLLATPRTQPITSSYCPPHGTPAPISCAVSACRPTRLLFPALVSHQRWAVRGVRVRSHGRRVATGCVVVAQTHAAREQETLLFFSTSSTVLLPRRLPRRCSRMCMLPCRFPPLPPPPTRCPQHCRRLTLHRQVPLVFTHSATAAARSLLKLPLPSCPRRTAPSLLALHEVSTPTPPPQLALCSLAQPESSMV
jgi:hypothetical protein